jgi:uncharacterized OB-fold protein
MKTYLSRVDKGDCIMGIKELLKLSDEEVRKPEPRVTRWSKPFWDMASEHKLGVKKCTSCGHLEHPPYLYCTECHSEEHEWVELSGKATLYAYAVNVHMVPFPFWDDMPYVVAMVDLEEGPRMLTNIVDCNPEDLKNGMALEVVFDDETYENFTLTKFRPAT